MVFGTKWAIRSAVFGFILNLLLVSSMFLLLVATKGTSAVKTIAMAVPFFIHTLEFLAAVSLLRTRRKDYTFLEKCSFWLNTTKYFSPCIILEEGILISWNFHFVILIIVAASYAVAMILVHKCLLLKCSVIKMKELENLMRRRNNNPTYPTAISSNLLHSLSTDQRRGISNGHLRPMSSSFDIISSNPTNVSVHEEFTCSNSEEAAYQLQLDFDIAQSLQSEQRALDIDDNEQSSAANEPQLLSETEEDNNDALPTYEDALKIFNDNESPSDSEFTDFPPSYCELYNLTRNKR